MTITAKTIADSINSKGKRITTFQLRYPRFIHAEELTHRILSTSPEEIVTQRVADGLMYDKNLSRNASSSRAIPVERMIQDVLDDTAMPIHWGKNQPGMQAREENAEGVLLSLMEEYHPDGTNRRWKMSELAHFEDFYDESSYFWVQQQVSPRDAWLEARNHAVNMARAFDNAGYHKQIVNRLLEPFMHINVVVTATEWDNFFALRDHPDAQPEIMVLAQAMKREMQNSTPAVLEHGEWHLPYITGEDHAAVIHYESEAAAIDDLIKTSVARCARVSYLTHDGKPTTLAEDVVLYDRLAKAQPPHLSPLEHQASPGDEMTGNFVGWTQYRKLFEASLGCVVA